MDKNNLNNTQIDKSSVAPKALESLQAQTVTKMNSLDTAPKLQHFVTSDLLPLAYQVGDMSYSYGDLSGFNDAFRQFQEVEPGTEIDSYTLPSTKRKLHEFASSFQLGQLPKLKVAKEMKPTTVPKPVKPTSSPAPAQALKGKISTGSWLPREEKILLHLMYAFASFELKTIAEVAWKCGILRPRRAIDKKIKRFLRFGKWRDRQVKQTREQIKSMIEERDMQFLSAADEKTFETVRDEYSARSMESRRAVF